jgi:chaperonin GroES
VGENAWEEAAARSPAFVKPQPGERVVISKYGGTLLTGKDGQEYRLMNDEDVVGRVAGG